MEDNISRVFQAKGEGVMKVLNKMSKRNKFSYNFITRAGQLFKKAIMKLCVRITCMLFPDAAYTIVQGEGLNPLLVQLKVHSSEELVTLSGPINDGRCSKR